MESGDQFRDQVDVTEPESAIPSAREDLMGLTAIKLAHQKAFRVPWPEICATVFQD